MRKAVQSTTPEHRCDHLPSRTVSCVIVIVTVIVIVSCGDTASFDGTEQGLFTCASSRSRQRHHILPSAYWVRSTPLVEHAQSTRSVLV
jgi:hypothetical protein